MCVETVCELLMRNGHCGPHPPWGNVFAFSYVTLIICPHLSLSLFSLFSHYLVSALPFFFPPECWHGSLLPPSLCFPSIYLELLSACPTSILKAAWEKFWPQTQLGSCIPRSWPCLLLCDTGKGPDFGAWVYSGQNDSSSSSPVK